MLLFPVNCCGFGFLIVMVWGGVVEVICVMCGV